MACAGRVSASGGQALAAACATGCEDLAATHGCSACAEAMAALAHELAGLIGAFHGSRLRSGRSSPCGTRARALQCLEKTTPAVGPPAPVFSRCSIALESSAAYDGSVPESQRGRPRRRRRLAPGTDKAHLGHVPGLPERIIDAA
jgi:hypothetical protein